MLFLRVEMEELRVKNEGMGVGNICQTGNIRDGGLQRKWMKEAKEPWRRSLAGGVKRRSGFYPHLRQQR